MRQKEAPRHAAWRENLTLPNGKTLEWGDEFTVPGEGRFVFRYGWNDREATCYGPVGSKEAKVRTFRADRITTIHRTKKEHP